MGWCRCAWCGTLAKPRWFTLTHLGAGGVDSGKATSQPMTDTLPKVATGYPVIAQTFRLAAHPIHASFGDCGKGLKSGHSRAYCFMACGCRQWARGDSSDIRKVCSVMVSAFGPCGMAFCYFAQSEYQAHLFSGIRERNLPP